jgi:predicted amidohydrolase
MVNKARAYDNHVYLLAANAVGPDAGNNYYFGHSMIVSPIAQTLALARGQEEIVSAKLDPDPIKYVSYGSKSPMIFDHLEDRNVAVYKEILQKGKSPFEPYKRIVY